MYSLWYKPEVLQVAESDARTSSQQDIHQKEPYETVAEKTSLTETPQVAETDEVKELQSEMAQQSSETVTPQIADTGEVNELQPDIAETIQAELFK